MLISSIVVVCFALIGYTYFGYPLCLWLFNQLKENFGLSQNDQATSSPTSSSVPPLVIAIITTVCNEASAVRDKLENSLALKYQGKTVSEHLKQRTAQVQLIVASDASSDETDAIVKTYQNAGVEFVRLAQRGGKELAQKAAVALIKAEIVVFTDVRVILNLDALDLFASYFCDSSVGAVSSRDNVSGATGEGLYVAYEMWLREQESRFNSAVGLSGSTFAVRSELCQEIEDGIPSDFSLLIAAVKEGRRGVVASDVVGSYLTLNSQWQEFGRKVRTVIRGIHCLRRHREILNPLCFKAFAWQIISHKVLRWLIPWFFIAGTLGSFYLAATSLFFMVLSFCLLSFLLCALIGSCFESARASFVCKVPLFFLSSNAAIALAWISYMSGVRMSTWSPTQSSANS